MVTVSNILYISKTPLKLKYYSQQGDTMKAGDSLRQVARDTQQAARDRRNKLQEYKVVVNKLRQESDANLKGLQQIKKEIDERARTMQKMERFKGDVIQKINDTTEMIKAWEMEVVNLERQAGDLERQADTLDKDEEALLQNSNSPDMVRPQ